ncbi:hypothetical protein PanWU01x14_167050, partial [Parasponia andersonii]
GAHLEEGWEGVLVGDNICRKNMSKERNSTKWGLRACIAAGQHVKDNNIWLRNLVEQVVGMVHGCRRRVNGAEVNEPYEDRNVILEMGFNGKGMNLLELS